MAMMPQDSAIKMSPELEARVAKASTPGEIAAIFQQAAVEQGLVVRDAYDPNVLLPTDRPTTTKVAKTYVVNGKKTILEADSPEEMTHKELEFFRAQNLNGTDSTQHVDQPRRDSETGRFVAAEQTEAEKQAEIYRKTELELKFKRGELSVQDYLQQSGAISEYLKSQGVDLSAVKEIAEEKIVNDEVASWEKAVAEFIETSDWPGGGGPQNPNMVAMQNVIAENDLPATAASLHQAYQFLKERNMLVESPERKLAECRTPQDLQNALEAWRPNGGSSLFGR